MIYEKGEDKRLSEKFWQHEFDCKCDKCTITIINPYLVEALQEVRTEINQGLYLSNAYRCEAHNRKVGGGALSFHQSGDAADLITPRKMDIYDFAKVLRKHFVFVKVYVGKNICHVQLYMH